MTEKMMILLLLVMRVRIRLLVGISLGRKNSPPLVISQSQLRSESDNASSHQAHC